MKKEIYINKSLTPENAQINGFEFIQDIIYDPEAPIDANKDLVTLAQQGYQLGSPASLGANDIFTGLYKPLKKSIDKNRQEV